LRGEGGAMLKMTMQRQILYSATFFVACALAGFYVGGL
jgi:hypothetical protein